MDKKVKKALPLIVSIFGLLIAGFGIGWQISGHGSTLVWVGVGITFIGTLLSAAAAKKPKE